MRILIVEDNAEFADALALILAPIRNAFPGASVVIVHTLEAALVEVEKLPAPDVTLLDLTLPPASMGETIARLKVFERRNAVVIVTGTPPQIIRHEFPDVTAEIVWKPDIIESPGLLHTVIARAFRRFHAANADSFKEQWERIQTLEAVANAKTD